MRHCPLTSFAAIALLSAAALISTPSTAQSPAPRQPLPPPGGQQRPPQAPPQQQAVTPKPYKPVAVGAPAPVNDPSFEAFRKQLEDVAKRKDRAGLARLVVAQGFFWEGEKGDKADKRKSGVDNLAAALSLHLKDGSGWEALAGYAADPTGMPVPQRKDTICSPAEPVFDAKELEAVAKATGTDESDWGYPVQSGLEVRAAAQPNAPVIEKLGMHFVWVMPENAPGNMQTPMLRVVTPSGKTGFVSGDALNPLGSDQLCYVKEAGGWKIVGFIGDE